MQDCQLEQMSSPASEVAVLLDLRSDFYLSYLVQIYAGATLIFGH